MDSLAAYNRRRICRNCEHTREDHNVECLCSPMVKGATGIRMYEKGCYHGMGMDRRTANTRLCPCQKFEPSERVAEVA